jgi:hypothetical protein
MGVASLIKKGVKLADSLFDEASPYLTQPVGEMTVDQIEMAIKNADALGLPKWRVNDLAKQLPKSKDAENLDALAVRAEEAINESARAGRGEYIAPQQEAPKYNPEPLIDWPGDSLLNPAPQAPKVPSQATGSTRYSRRRAIRTAPWADNAAINRVYENAKRLSDSSGVEHEVDHVIPLRGDYVSGLHHQDNLLIVPKDLNRVKSNLFDVGLDPMKMNDTATRNATLGNERFISENPELVGRRIKDKKAKSAIESEAIDKELSGRVGHLARLNRALRNGKHYGSK